MFDRIAMLRFDLDTPIIPSNYRSQVIKYEKKVQDAIDQSFLDALHSDFTLAGHIEFIPPWPASKLSLQRALYVQFFALFTCDNTYYTKRKDYESYLLLYTYHGKGILEYEGCTYTLTEGEGFLIDCRKPHYYYAVGEWEHGDLHFNGTNMTDIYQEFVLNNIVKFFSPVNGIYQSQLEKLLYHYVTPSSHRELIVSNLLEALLISVLMEAEQQRTSVVPETLRYLLKYMESNFTSPLTLDALSKFSGISKYHLSREFKKYTGYSPNDYLIEFRISQAKIMLTNTDLPSYKIGIIVGIPNENNFINQFKKKTGITPKKYREENRSITYNDI